MRPPYPIAAVPLLPQFLQRRNATAEFPLRAAERLGLDRPAYFLVVGFAVLDPQGERLDDVGNGAYRTTNDPLKAACAAAETAGLIASDGARWMLTERGRRVVDEHRRALAAHYATLAPIDADDLAELGELLEDAFAAGARAPRPATRPHTARALRYRRAAPTSDFARLDAAVYALWQVRDDCHVQAWRDAGLDGPTVDVLTRVWRREAGTADELAGQLSGQRPEDVRAALERLRVDWLVADAEPLALTAGGTALRERIEADTDELFFAPWPEDVGARADWVVERLAAVNAALA